MKHDVEALGNITAPPQRRVNVITIDGAPMVVVYEFKGADFRDNLTHYLEGCIAQYMNKIRKEKP